jgi:hypothetical protein
MMANALVRPEGLKLPEVSSTYGENGWKRPPEGAAYTITTPHGERPIINTSLRYINRRKRVRQPWGVIHSRAISVRFAIA